MKIDKDIEQRILSAARVTDVLRDHGVELFKKGTSLLGLCPFHDDRHLGSFVVNERKNIFYCFSCGAHGDAVTVLRELDGLSYPDALRVLAAMYGIIIDDGPVPKVKKYEPRKPLPPTTMLWWPADILAPYRHHDEQNNLLRWMYSLNWPEGKLADLKVMVQLYQVGTSIKGATAGWTIFPQIDTDLRVRDVKLMAYLPDGHRKKDGYSFNWMHSMMEKAGTFNPDTHHIEHCLFGLHLMKAFPKAEVCIVESEKTALICSAFTDPNKKIWMATGGKSGLNPSNLQPLMDAKRVLILYPDFDGYDEWRACADAIDYGRMTLTLRVRNWHIPSDGPKADIADIMIRRMQGIEETEAEKACRMLGLDHIDAGVADMIDKLDLKLTNK